MTTNISTQALFGTASRQFAFILLGYLGYILFARYFKIEYFTKSSGILSMIMIGSLLVPRLFGPINGAYAWIPIPGLGTIQPSEFAKLGLIIVFAVYLGDIKRRNTTFSEIVQFPAFYFFVTFLIIMLFQKDTGTAIVLFVIAFFEFMMAGHKKLAKAQMIMIGLIVIGILGALVLLSPAGIHFLKNGLNLPDYMVARFENTINPFTNKYGSGYQLVNGLVAFVKGNWSGVGFGKSLQKYGYLPAAKTDFILAVIAVPLLMLSSGGSSTLSIMFGLGIAQAVIIRQKKEEIE